VHLRASRILFECFLSTSASQGSPKKAAGAWLQEKLLSVMSIGDNEKENKSKIGKNEAAVVIQSRKLKSF
jgi:hypothetical protein